MFQWILKSVKKPEIININSNEPLFHPYSIVANKYGGSCININDAYAQLSVPDVVKNINVRVFTVMLRSNERRHKMAWKF